MTTPALVARNLTKAYGERLALDGVDLSIDAGEVVALVGHNGSGKSTLLGIAAGLLDATDGELFIAGHEVGSIGARAALSYIPDNPVLYDDLSVLEHLEYVARVHGDTDWQPRAEDLIGRLGLTGREDELPITLSRGLRQKAMIALGVVRPYRLLLVDEPFVGLDAAGREALLVVLAEAGVGGASVVVATHQLDFVGRADRLVALRDGELIHDGPPSGADLARLVEG